MTALEHSVSRRPDPAHRRPAFRHTAILAALTALAGWGPPAQAALIQASYELKFDGTENFDPASGNGFDTSANNQIVRTHDSFGYQVSVSTNNADQNLRIQLRLPAGPDGKPLARWSYIPCQ